MVSVIHRLAIALHMIAVAWRYRFQVESNPTFGTELESVDHEDGVKD